MTYGERFWRGARREGCWSKVLDDFCCVEIVMRCWFDAVLCGCQMIATLNCSQIEIDICEHNAISRSALPSYREESRFSDHM